jgi:hypothetical protein
MIAPELVEAVAAQVEAGGASETTLSKLRESYPQVHFTYCMDDDVQEAAQPCLTRPGFNLYLVDGRDHCMKLTVNPAEATGLVLAEILED